MSLEIAAIDWREQFASLQPHLEGEGGYVRVRYSGENCAPLSFVKALSSRYEKSHGKKPDDLQRTSVRLDPAVFTTRYLDDVLNTLARKVGLTLEKVSRPNPLGPLSIGSQNQAGGDLNVEVNIDYGDTSFDLSDIQHRKSLAVASGIREYLENGRLMIVLFQANDGEHGFFWRDLWANYLANLQEQGLLLVKMYDTSKMVRDADSDEPHPVCEISLPSSLDENAEAAAITDMAHILIEKGRLQGVSVSAHDARNMVSGVVVSHRDDVCRLHNVWAGTLMRLIAHATPQ